MKWIKRIFFKRITGDRLKSYGFKHTPNNNNGGHYLKEFVKYNNLHWGMSIFDLSNEKQGFYGWYVNWKTTRFNERWVELPADFEYMYQIKRAWKSITGTRLKKI